MSDYFDHLAAIVLGTAPTLSPRRAARFEPAGMMEIAPDFDVTDEVAATTQPQLAGIEGPSVATPDVPTESPRSPRLDDAPEIPAGRVGVTPVFPAPTVPGNRQEMTTPAPGRPVAGVDTAAPGPAPRVQAVVEPSRDVRARARPAIRPAPATPLTGLEPTASDIAPVEPASTVPGAWAGHDPAIPVETFPEPPSDLDFATDPPPRTLATGTRSATSGPVAHIDAAVRGTRADARQIPAPLSTIQVTIGRVEVRAVQPPAPRPSPPAAAKPPAMTLDDYLAARDRGSS